MKKLDIGQIVPVLANIGVISGIVTKIDEMSR